jgi:hypothetical protein
MTYVGDVLMSWNDLVFVLQYLLLLFAISCEELFIHLQIVLVHLIISALMLVVAIVLIFILFFWLELLLDLWLVLELLHKLLL